MTTRACPTCGVDLPADAPESLCPRCLLRIALEPNHSPGPAAAAPPAPEALAPHFPQLEILGLIGHGGMGAVYKARQIKLDRLVALKVLPHRADSDPTFAERFVREARALARLQHPHIVTVHDFGEAGGYYYLLMEHVDGANLRQVMKSGPLPAERAVPILSALADALAYAHQHEVVHRDLKPENVLIDRRGQVKLADFGLAKLIRVDAGAFSLTDTNQAVGTPHYMAPEQLERPQEVDHRADLYALGVVAYEMLTGELPLGRFDPPSQRSSVYPDLDEVVLRALERDPARRYQSAQEMRDALDSLGTYSRAAPPAATGAPARPVVMKPANEIQVIVGLFLGLVLVLVGIAFTRSEWSYLCWPAPLIWFWLFNHVYKFFKGINPHDRAAAVEKRTPDWNDLGPREQQILRALYLADEGSIVTYSGSTSGKQMAELREANELPPEERVLAHVSLSRDGEAALIFGCLAMYFPATQNGEPIRCSVSYDTVPRRRFVNHGQAVYIGDGIVLTPANRVSCEVLAALLNAVRRAVAESVP